MSADDAPTGPRHGEPPPEPCMVPECGQPSVRHLSLTEARKAFDTLPEEGRRAPLCKTHYKAWKKATKEARTIDRLTR
jgi:hypothetical protein